VGFRLKEKEDMLEELRERETVVLLSSVGVIVCFCGFLSVK